MRELDMSNRNERRRKENYKLRVYFDAIKQAKEFTAETWGENLIASGMPYIALESWIAYLEGCALREAAKTCGKAA